MRNLIVLVVGAPIALATWSFVLKRPAVMLAAYAGTIPFASLVGLPLGLPSPFNTLSTTLGLVTAFVVGLHVALRRPSAGAVDSVAKIWLAFLALSALSVFWSVNPSATQQQVFVLASLVGLYVASSMLPMRWTQVDTIEKAIILGGAATGAYGFFLLATGNLHQTNAGAFRFETAGGGGDGGDPNITAAALLLPLALSIGYYIRQDAFGHRLRYFFTTTLIVGAIVLTGSRGGILGIVIVVGVTYINDRRRLVHLGLIVVLLAGVALTVPGEITERLTGSSSTGRTAIWQAAITACPDYCLTGAGFGTFSDVFESVWLSDQSVAVSNPRVGAHNVWLGVAIEVGIAGLLLLLVGLGLTAGRLSHVPADRRGPPLAGLAGVLFANTFVANLDFKYFWLVLTYALFVLLAHAESLASAASEQASTPSTGGTRAADSPAPSNGQERGPEPTLVDVKGVGYLTSLQLQLHGIKTVGQLARTPLDFLITIPGFAQRRARNVKRSAILLEISDEESPSRQNQDFDFDEHREPGRRETDHGGATPSRRPRRTQVGRHRNHRSRAPNPFSEDSGPE
jgi:O-antigen ligase